MNGWQGCWKLDCVTVWFFDALNEITGSEQSKHDCGWQESYKKNVMVSSFCALVMLFGVNVRVSLAPTMTWKFFCASAAPARARVARMVENCIL